MKQKSALLTVFSCLVLSCYAEEGSDKTTPAAKEKNHQIETKKISEAIGHMIGKNMESLGFQFDIQYVIKGLKDGAAGKDSPMTEVECIQAITEAQEKAFEEQSKVNLAKAEDFLQKNASVKDVVSLEGGKVQYRVEKEGDGPSIQRDFSPLIRYVGKFIDGKEFAASKEDEPMALEEVIPGLRQAMIGMKEGEKRTIFIHPTFAYGTQGMLPPNSLLTFEVEIVKANFEKKEEKQQPASSKESKKTNQEIAFPEQSFEKVR